MVTGGRRGVRAGGRRRAPRRGPVPEPPLRSADRGDPRPDRRSPRGDLDERGRRPSTGSSRLGARGRSSSLRSTSTHSSSTLLAEAAARTGADAVVLRVEGPAGDPSSLRSEKASTPSCSSGRFDPPDRRSFRAATVDWTYAPFDDAETAPFRSALVAPLGDERRRPRRRRRLLEVARRLSSGAGRHAPGARRRGRVALANARRFADVEARAFLDPASGVPDRRGYELELEREVARARRTGQPLTVAIVALDDGVRAERRGNGIGELARLVGRVTRGTDVPCRRGGRELAILLPETRESEASRLTVRLREEAQRALGRSGQTTFAVGLAEWRPNESVEALDARAAAALPAAARRRRGRPRVRLPPRAALHRPRTLPETRTDCASTPSRSSRAGWTSPRAASTP